MRNHHDRNNVPRGQIAGTRTAVGYIRVSTDMQAADGLSLDAQRAAIQSYCESVGLQLLQIQEDVESGGKADRKGLARALATRADVVVVLKFDRLSRSIKHFCDLYEILTPRKYCESLTLRMGHRPSYPHLAKLLSEVSARVDGGNA